MQIKALKYVLLQVHVCQIWVFVLQDVFFLFLLFFIDLCSVHCIYGIIWFDGREHSKKLYQVLYNDVVELSMFNEKNISVSIWSFQYEF